MRTRFAAVLLPVLALLLVAPVHAQETFCPPGQEPHYVFGFKDLHDRLGQKMGEPLTCEFPDPNGTGDVHQQTTQGLSFWRKSTNTPTFTNGYEHWAISDRGFVYWLGDSIDPTPDAAPVEAPTSSPPPRPDGPAAAVTRVVDGDTIVVAIPFEGETTVRLIGIDTPETVAPGQPVECYGAEASSRLRELVEGRVVFLETDPSQDERDRFGRLLAYVILRDGTNVGELMLREGYAREFTFAAPYRHQALYRAAEGEAQAADRGLWGACEMLVPEAIGEYAGPYDPAGPDRDCSDFDTWEEAQAFFLAAGGPASDPHRLDGNRDGIACESLRGSYG